MIEYYHSQPYTHSDLPRLQAALAGWISEAGDCGYCHIGDLPQRIYAGLRGRRPVGELVQLWEDGGQIVGVAITFRFDTAFDLFTAPALRGSEAELAMLQSACLTTRRQIEDFAQQYTPVVTDVFSCDETRKRLLARLGFVEYRLWDYITERELSEAIAAPRLPAGFTLRSATSADYAQLAAVRNSAFGEGWSAELYRDEVMHRPGYQPERELVIVAPGEVIAAFTIIWLDALNRVGLFEPVGTHRDFQRRGLARALMCYGLGELQRLGMQRAMVAHDASNLAAHALYAGLGFVKKYETLGYRQGHPPA